MDFKGKTVSITGASSGIGRELALQLSLLGAPLRSAYSGAKHAIIGIMDCLRAQIHSSGVIIQVVCPGWVQTDVSRNAPTASGEALGELDADIAGGQPGRQIHGPDDLPAGAGSHGNCDRQWHVPFRLSLSSRIY